IIYILKRRKLNLMHFGDASAPALMLAYGIARLGCHLSGDGDWGIPNDDPKPSWMSFLPDWIWAYNYPNNALGVDLKSYFTELGYISNAGKAWPTPIYEFIMCLILFLILWNLRKKIKIPGLLFSIYLVLNGLERYTIEIIRINPVYDLLGINATMAQLIAIIFLLFGFYGIWYFSYKSTEINVGNF
ncbi:MAG: prolipoprotein diacylglyceryl transferase, partial [Cyclobacteriaceae bacterium]|nr:prolipoprotein diacylglyceryl transferase [Cyclobacteriaceae bacterium]